MTAKLGFASQTKGVANWHTPLEAGFQTAEDRLTLTGSGSPQGVVAGHYVGQRYWQSVTFSWWVCTTATGVAGTSVWLKEIATGTIVMFSGPLPSPNGWRLCDGGGGSPDLRGKFIVGLHTGDPDYNVIGDVGGAKTHTLVAGNVPQLTTDADGAHSHVVKTFDGGDAGNVRRAGAGGAGVDAATEAEAAHTHTVGNVTPTAVDHRPPFYTLAYIMKL